MSDLNRRAAEAMGCPKDIHTPRFFVTASGDIRWRHDHYTSFDPCTRIDHAWMLVEWLVEHGYDVELQYTGDFDDMCWYIYLEDKQQDLDLYADTAPLAITRAFLEAVGDSE